MERGGVEPPVLLATAPLVPSGDITEDPRAEQWPTAPLKNS